jgi:hypothetical protein
MEVLIVPCTQEKVWDIEPNSGPTAAKDAYVKAAFTQWRRYAEDSGCPWFVLSTKYGLLEPDEPVPGAYNVPISAALQDPRLARRLAEQAKRIDFSRFERVVLLDWERFEPLVRAAVGSSVPCALRKILY